jgi:hypothetical protein
MPIPGVAYAALYVESYLKLHVGYVNDGELTYVING